jgi:hypothetical protein
VLHCVVSAAAAHVPKSLEPRYHSTEFQTAVGSAVLGTVTRTLRVSTSPSSPVASSAKRTKSMGKEKRKKEKNNVRDQRCIRILRGWTSPPPHPSHPSQTMPIPTGGCSNNNTHPINQRKTHVVKNRVPRNPETPRTRGCSGGKSRNPSRSLRMFVCRVGGC